MTEDIVKRLRRDLASGLSASIGDTEEAADEIERLREDNAHLDRMWLAAIDSVGVVRAETKQAAADEIERLARDMEALLADRVTLRAALRPFSELFLYPDDFGFEDSLDIKEDPDWDDDANDMQTEKCFVLRRSIKAARAALAGDQAND